ncbi:MAG: hypothetical protein JWL69_4916 [Phycisphaerales bacterium]|nr:hypothetical protein [Phycisphaerales bacterium]
MLKPLEEWICDVCSEVIPSPNKGCVIWQTTEDEGHPYNFTIIHQGQCDKKHFHHSQPLRDFLGVEGIPLLLTFVTPGPIKRKLGDKGEDRPKDLDEFADFFRRVQTPYYEEARMKFSDPALLDDNSDNNELAPYLPKNLKRIIERYA